MDLTGTLNESGIMVTFNPYVVGPYAMGAVTVPLPYSSYASYLNPDYTTPETISAGNGELTEEIVTKIRTSRLEGGRSRPKTVTQQWLRQAPATPR